MTQAPEAPARTRAQISEHTFRKDPYWAWTKISQLNARHMQLAWITLGTLMLTDLYILLVASGAFSDPRIFN